MQSHSSPRRFNARQLVELLAQSAAGIALSGDSGSGKSNALCLMFEQLVRQGIGATLIDPHGDLARDVEQVISALPPRLRQRCLIVRPSDLAHVVALNPLAVPANPGDWLRWRARVASKVSQVTQILLHAWGERDTNSKPLLFKWMTRALTTLAVARLTLADARHFFHVGSDIYAALAAAAPDLLARTEMTELADLRPREREELIASTKNRMLGFLENPAVELTLGRPHGWLDPTRLIRERYVTIVSLEAQGVLRGEDVEIFANLWLTELLFAAYNVPRDERTPHVVFLDELPVFASSFDVLSKALSQVRKFQLRFICAFQGTQYFPERTEDRLLNALIGQCRTTIVFRHKNPVDARFFGDLVALPEFDPWREKHRLTQLQQYQDGHDLVYLTDESESWSDASQAGGSAADAVTESTSHSSGQTSSRGESEAVARHDLDLAETVTKARNDSSGGSTSQGSTSGASRTEGRSWSTTSTSGGSRTRKASLVPRIRNRRVVSSVQFLSPDEQTQLVAREIARRPIGEALLYTAGQAAVPVRFPLARPPYVSTPRYAMNMLRLLHEQVTAGPNYASPTRISAERQEFEQSLLAHLQELAAMNDDRMLPKLPPPEENPLLSI